MGNWSSDQWQGSSMLMSYPVAELKLETRSLGLCSPCNSWFISRETRPGLWGHLPGGRTTCDCGPSCGPRSTSFSLWVSISSSTIWDQSLCTPSRKDQGKAALGRTRVSGTPPPSSRWGNWLSSSECPPQGTGQVCAERGWTGQNPSLEDAAATLVTSRVGPWIGSRPGDRAPGPDSDSATHRVTLDKCCPPWGPAAPPLWWECWTKQRTFTLSFELHSEGAGPALELWQMTLNCQQEGWSSRPHETWGLDSEPLRWAHSGHFFY